MDGKLVGSQRLKKKIKLHEKLIAKDSWIIEGNSPSTLVKRVKRADTVIFLNLPRRIITMRWAKRLYKHRGKSRPDMGGNNVERFNWKYLYRLLLRYPRKEIIKQIRSHSNKQSIIILSNKKEIRNFLDSVK